VLDRIRRVPNPEQLVEGSLVRVNPRGAGIFAHGAALMEPSLDIFGVGQVGDDGEVSTAE
jgi:hypothetical protein